MDCPTCKGTCEIKSPIRSNGWYEDFIPCPDCNGTGEIEGAKNTEQHVPADNKK